MDRQNQDNPNAKFVELLTPNYYKIHSFILALVPNKTDAEDILQSSISYMWEHIADFKQGTNFLSWAFTISKYQVLSYRKKQQRSIVFFSEEATQLIASENQALSREIDGRLEALDECMQKLEHRDLAFLKKRFEMRTSAADLAVEFKTSVNVVYKRLAQIKNMLLSCIHKAMAAGEAS
ncbi:MAG: sigma-70 family RNA polymerase sigma factor [Planctomycetaceae bacterium]|nr:sigma-70 family RNA polymerase sigma factor [Planctomycetaceae bacterium]